MLILTRKFGQVFLITPQTSLNLSTPVSEVFCKGPIEVKVMRVYSSQVRLGIKAPSSLLVLREELNVERTVLVGGKQRIGVDD